MIKAMRFFAGALTVLSVLAACSAPTQQPVNLGEMSRNEFMSALRWKRFGVAANLMQPEYREDFKQVFAKVPEIHITDVRLIDLTTELAGRRFNVTVEMDYYLLPSVTVKTFRFDQTWVYFSGGDRNQQGFFITTPFPPLP